MRLTALIPLLLLPLSIGCSRKPSGEESESAPTPTVPVKTAKVILGDVPVIVSATGRTDALHKEKIYSPIAGKIVSLKALEGTFFRSGEIMAVIRTRESQAAITGAEKLLRVAGTPDQKKEGEEALALALATQSMVDLRAKFNGTISSRTVTEGELVPENGELFTEVDLSSLVFIADVPLPSLPAVHEGQQAEVQCAGLPDRVIGAIVEAIAPQTDLQSQSVKVRLRFPRMAEAVRRHLKTDMMGTARIVTGFHRGTMLVPHSALLRNDEDNTYSLVVIVQDSIARIIPVTVGIMNDSLAEVASPLLHQGTLVVREGNYALPDSTTVTVADRREP